MTRDKAIKLGYQIYCLGCSAVYKSTPTEQYEDGHGGRQLEMCRCGSDLFANLADDTPVTTATEAKEE